MKRKNKLSQNPPNAEEQLSQQLQRYQAYLSSDEFEALKKEIDQPLLPTFRINPLKVQPGFTKTLANKYGWKLSAIPFCSTGFKVESDQGFSISAALEHKNGMYYIQEAASMLPVELFTINPSEEDITLDLAASPGGKTTHILARQMDRGLVLANDSSQGRIQALKIVLQHCGACSAAVTRFPGEKYGAWFPNTFTRVLIDAPCSMQGLRTTESHVSRPVTEKESRSLAQRQTALLTSALQAVRPGGEVVYSTCTLLPEEDEGVVESILKKFGSSVELLNANRFLPIPAPGIQIQNGQAFQYPMNNVVRLWPHRYGTAGFFACIFQKTADLDLPTLRPPEHSMENAGFFELNQKQELEFAVKFEEWSGYPLADSLLKNNHSLVRHNERIFVFPKLLLDQFRTLPVQSAGLLLGEDEPDGFALSQEWALRYGKDCKNISIQLDEKSCAAFTKGEDVERYSDSLPTESQQRIVLDSAGLVLGRGKTLPDRLKNLSFRQLA